MLGGSQMKSPGQWDRAGAPKILASVMGSDKRPIRGANSRAETSAGPMARET
jgi:hypothetical protein